MQKPSCIIALLHLCLMTSPSSSLLVRLQEITKVAYFKFSREYIGFTTYFSRDFLFISNLSLKEKPTCPPCGWYRYVNFYDWIRHWDQMSRLYLHQSTWTCSCERSFYSISRNELTISRNIMFNTKFRLDLIISYFLSPRPRKSYETTAFFCIIIRVLFKIICTLYSFFVNHQYIF